MPPEITPEHVPGWVWLLIVGAGAMWTLLMLALKSWMGGLSKKINENTTLTVEALTTAREVKEELLEKFHKLEVKVIGEFTPIKAHDELRGRVHSLGNDLAPIKALHDLDRVRRPAGRG